MLRPEGHIIKTLLHTYNLTCWLQTDVKDTNGAGDTFATTYMLAMAVNDRQPGVTANWAASRAVAQPQVL
jgi:sugar/nucleoside kinase (ribokinase family)